jgi:hypothetical protein
VGLEGSEHCTTIGEEAVFAGGALTGAIPSIIHEKDVDTTLFEDIAAVGEAETHVPGVAVEVDDGGEGEGVGMEEEPGVKGGTIVGFDEVLFVVVNAVIGGGTVPWGILSRSFGHAGDGGVVEELILEVVERAKAEGEEAPAGPDEVG